MTTIAPEEGVTRGEGLAALAARLCRKSVDKHHDAYGDVDWDAPENRIDAADPRWIVGADRGLGRTRWYRELPVEVQARLGLHLVVCAMETGWQFENVLSRGLLEFAFDQPEASVRRYAYHELIEEAQHTLMFQEFVRRSGLPAPGLAERQRRMAGRVVSRAREYPELFFVFVLGGEDPIDHAQRTVLASDRDLHPLVRRIMQIHVTEEARHLAFARAYLRERAPRLGTRRRAALSLLAPVVLGQMARLMLGVPAFVAEHYRIPGSVLREVRQDPSERAHLTASLDKVRDLLAELELIPGWTRPVWSGCGVLGSRS